ncbi:MAG: GTP 3',8-cyclase MoaA [Methyloligellaceae bacterium]
MEAKSRPLIHDALTRPLRDLRISIIDRCNFRCGYCMPPDASNVRGEFLPRKRLLSDVEIERLVIAFVDLGVAKIRITGGEPLLRPGLVSLVERLAGIAGVKDLALITNGILLQQMAQDLAHAGLGRITVSLDSLDEEVFAEITGGRGSVAQVLAGIDAAERSGFGELKINTVVQRGVNDHTVLDMVRHFRGSGHILRLIEYMDVGISNQWSPDRVVPGSELLNRIHDCWPLRPLASRYPGETARRYFFEDGAGEIGLINSITEPFCGQCSRGRVSADGMFHTCLFSGQGSNLRPLLSSVSDRKNLAERIRSSWSERRNRYSEVRGELRRTEAKVEMYRLGG